MVARNPLVLVAGAPAELPSGDTLNGIAAGGTVSVVAARIKLSVAQSIPAGAGFTLISFDGIPLQKGGTFWTIGNPTQIIIPEDGVYCFSFEATGAAPGVSVKWECEARIVNPIGAGEFTAGVGETAPLKENALRECTAGQILTFGVRHNNGAAMNIQAEGDHSPDVWLFKVGGAKGDTGIALQDSSPTVATVLRDDFIGGSTETGEIGEQGWSFTNGSVAAVANEQNHPGMISRTSGTVAAQVASMVLGPNNASSFRFDEFDECTWIFRATVANTDAAYRIGIGENVTVASFQTHGIFLERAATDTNWFFVSRNNSAQTRTDSGVAFNTSWVKIKMRRVSATDVRFSINNATEIAIVTTVPDPADLMALGNQIVPTTTTARVLLFDFCSIKFLPVLR
jgi:hypothetical protein